MLPRTDPTGYVCWDNLARLKHKIHEYNHLSTLNLTGNIWALILADAVTSSWCTSHQRRVGVGVGWGGGGGGVLEGGFLWYECSLV